MFASCIFVVLLKPLGFVCCFVVSQPCVFVVMQHFRVCGPAVVCVVFVLQVGFVGLTCIGLRPGGCTNCVCMCGQVHHLWFELKFKV